MEANVVTQQPLSGAEPDLDAGSPVGYERRRFDRKTGAPNADLDWESKALARVRGHLKEVPATDTGDQPKLGWEATVLDVLRRRIERGPL